MFHIRFLCAILYLFMVCRVGAQSLIRGYTGDPKHKIQFYRPFPGFANTSVPEEVYPDAGGMFVIRLDHSHPYMLKIVLNDTPLLLFLSPGDSLTLIPNLSNSADQKTTFFISGDNADGISYYNFYYNARPTAKFEAIDKAIASFAKAPEDSLFQQVEVVYEQQANWIDSLLKDEKVTDAFALYFRTEIFMQLFWGVDQSCKKYFKELSSPSVKGKKIRSQALKMVSEDPAVMCFCISSLHFFSDYYKFKIKNEASPAATDTAALILNEDFYFLSIAPYDIRKYVIGNYLLRYREVLPGGHDYCRLYDRYAGEYGINEISAYMKALDLCKNGQEPENMVLLGATNEKGIFPLLEKHFKNKRLYIDIWATWCLPCKAEFNYYDKAFTAFLNEYGITNVFLSIDDMERHETWEQEVKALRLPGFHVRANNQLRESIKEQIFKGDDMVIPRYVLIDEYGQILSVNARRPAAVRSEIARLFDKKK